MTRALVLALMGTTLALAACDDDVTGPEEPRPGILEWEGLESADPVLEAPDTVRAEMVVEVVVRTWAPNGCWAPAETVVTYGTVEPVVLVQPYDRRTGPLTESCEDEPTRLARTVPLTFSEEGVTRIKVSGGRVEAGEDPATADGRVAIESQIRVLPTEPLDW